MKKILSTITAAALFAGSTMGLSVNAAGFKLSPNIFNSEMTMKLMAEAERASEAPTASATAKPSESPTASVKPTENPTAAPTEKPTAVPTEKPTAAPTEKPTEKPTAAPTEKPTDAPTAEPTAAPTPGITGLILNKQSLELKKGESFKLIASTQPEDAPDEEVTWSATSDCVKLSEDGTVTAVSAGNAIVSATAVKSKYVASCYIEIENEDGIVQLSVTDGVKEVIIRKNGEAKELTAGDNTVEAGTYEVSAKSYDGYTLKAYSETISVEKNKTTELSVEAEKTACEIKLPSTAGVTITPTGGSVSPVELGGSYSFTVSLGSSYDASNIVVKANGKELTAENGIYTISDIKDDVVITIDGVESKSWDATLKSVKVKGCDAILGGDNTYTVTIPYGETASLSDIAVEVNDSKSEHTITSDDGYYVITVKAEDGTTNVYKLSVKNASATNIDELKLAISNLKFSDVIQSSNGVYSSQETVLKEIESKIKEAASAYPDIKFTVEKGEILEPQKGTLASPTGVDGYYRFTVTLSENLSTAEDSEKDTREIPLEIKINSYDYTISSMNITATTTALTIKNLDSNCEVALFLYGTNGRMRTWTAPTNGVVTFTNLAGGETYTVKVRAQGSDEIPTGGTTVTMKKSTQGASKYYTVTFDEGEHGRIVAGKAKQTVGLSRVAVYPTIQADDGYIFKGWSSNGRLIEDPKTYYIRCTTAFTAIYEKSSGSSYSSSSRPQSTTQIQSPAAPSVMTFYDVPTNSWYYDNVMNICKKGYMNGTSNNMFEPEAKLTRAMLVTILYRYACEPEVYGAGSSFSDVKAGTWYSDAVTWAADAGIVNGVENNRFDPDANITREQLAAIMYRYSDAFGYDISDAGNIIKYSDSVSISDWAQTALIWTTGAGIIDGKDGNRLDPQGKATRAEAATIIGRFDDFINR